MGTPLEGAPCEAGVAPDADDGLLTEDMARMYLAIDRDGGDDDEPGSDDNTGAG
ncbi:hypothetical protein [Aquisphaera giovannonii]|nr:hypothetical protein [Aquisphaera giovannonii]